MNKHCYRLIFSRSQGELRVVSELARGCSIWPGQRRGTGASRLWVTVRRAEWLLGLALFAGPALAHGIVADGRVAHELRPEVISTRNGLPQVNITAPNQAGLSHNHFQQFDVGPQGAILNNSAEMITTQMAGIIQGNPNLNPNAAPARVILNEVNSDNPSQLRGFLEVAGGMAQVIVANPSGIVCDGCGTINAGRMTLTTGRPQLNADGSLAGYQVERGLVRVEGGGLNNDARHDTRYVDILARAVKLNASVRAENEILVVAGRNHISANGQAVTPLASDSTAPELAIDMGQLGGMYSGQIRMIGTEAGVGVRGQGGHLRAGATLAVSSEGRLSWQSGAVEMVTQAGGDITLAARGTIEHHGKLHSGGRLVVQSREGVIRQSGTLAATGDVRLDAARGIQGSGHMLAGSNENSALIRGADLTLHSQDDIRVSGSLLSQKDVNITGRRIDIGQGRLAAERAVFVAQAGGVVLQQATVDSGQLTINTTGNIDAQKAQVRAGHWDINADSLFSPGGVWSQVGPGGSRLILIGSLDNTDGDIDARQLTLDVASVNNRHGRLAALDEIAQHWRVRGRLSNHEGVVGCHGNLTLELGDLDNQDGTVKSQSELSIRVQENIHSLGGKLLAGQKLTLNTLGTVDNRSGRVQGGHLQLRAQGLNNAHGHLVSGGHLHLSAHQSVDNQHGLIDAGNALDVSTDGDWSNQGGKLVSKGDLHLNAHQSVDNRNGLIEAAETLDMRTGGGWNNREGTALGAGQVNVVARDLDNAAGKVRSGGGMMLGTAGNLINQAGTLSATQGLSWQGGTDSLLENDAGTLLSGAPMSLRGGHLHNRQKGTIQSQQAVTLDLGGGWDNQGGELVSEGSLHLNAHQAVDNRNGLIEAAGTLDMRTGGGWDNREGTALGAGQVNVVARDLNNAAGKVRSGGGMMLSTAGNLINQAGTLSATQGLSWQGGTDCLLENDAGTVFSGAQMSLRGGHLHNRQKGTIQSQQAVTLDLEGGWDNQGGELVSEGSLHLNAHQAVDNRNGLIEAAGTLDMRTGGGWDNREGTALGAGQVNVVARDLNNAAGKVRSGGGMMLSTAGNLINQAGTLSATQGLSWQGGTDSLLENDAGTLLSGAQMSLRGGHLHNRQKGTIQSQQAVTLDLDGVWDNQGGKLISMDHGAIRALSLLNAMGDIQAFDALDVHLIRTLDNSNGLVSSQGSQSLRAENILNAGGEMGSQGGWSAVTRRFDNSEGSVLSMQDAALTVTGLDNRQGSLQSKGSLMLRAVQDIRNELGKISAQARLDVQGVTDGAAGGKLRNAGGQLTSGDALNVTAQSVDNQQNGLIYSQKQMRLALTDALDNRQGKLVSGEGVQISARSLLNTQGTLKSSGDQQISADRVDNLQGGVLCSLDALTLAARTLSNLGGMLISRSAGVYRIDVLNNQEGKIHSDGTLTLNGDQINNPAGDLASTGTLTLVSAQLDNSGQGKITSRDALDVGVNRLNNRDGGLLLGTIHTDITAHELENSAGWVQSVGTLTLSQMTRLDNRQGHLLANGTLSINATDPNALVLFNQGGNIKSGDRTVVNTQTLNNQGGTIFSQQALTATVQQDYTHQVGDTINSNGETILSVGGVLINLADWLLSGDLTVNSAHFTNLGSLVGKTLNLTTGALINQGRIEADSVTLISDTTNNRATLVGGDVNVRSRIIDNDGRDVVMAATESLNLTAGERLTNRDGGLIYSANTLQLVSDDNIENRASRIEADGDVLVDAQRLDNLREGLDIEHDAEKSDYKWRRANLYWRSYGSKVNPDKSTIAPTTQRLTFNDDDAAANSRYGTLLEIDAAGKKAQLYVKDNKGKMRSVWVNYLELTPGSDGGYDMTFYETRGFRQKGVPTPYHNTFWREHDRGRIDTWDPDRYIDVAEAPFVTDYSNFRERTVTGSSSTDKLVSAGSGAHILAGGNMVLRIAGQLFNDASTLSANRDLSVEGDGKLINQGYSVNRRDQEYIVDHYDKDTIHWYPTFNRDETTALATIDSILTGHGNVAIKGTHIENTTVNPAQISTVQAAQKAAEAERAEWQHNPLAFAVDKAKWSTTHFQLTPRSRPLTQSELELIPAGRRLAPGEWALTSAQRNLPTANLTLTPGSRPLTPAEITLTHQQHLGRVATSIPNNGLFRQQPDAGSAYLVVTDRRFTDRGKFISSDYLLQRIGYDPAKVHKRLSDGYYEQRLVREQLLQLTGRPSVRGENAMAQYQSLMNNGSRVASDFQLVPGIALTPAQIAALQQDIVWLVSETVDTAEGPQTVWVPKVYLAGNTLRLTGEGALIGGGNLSVSTRSLDNAGNLFADEALKIDTSHFLQEGGEVRADAISIHADSLALSTRLQDALRQATMTARELSLTSGDILLRGARLKAAQNLSLNARNNLDITTAKNSTEADLRVLTGTIGNRAGDSLREDGNRLAQVSGEWQQALGSELSAGGNLSLKAGQNLSLLGSQAQAGGNTHVRAGGDVKLLADTTTNTTHLSAGSRTSSVSNRREEDRLHLSTLSGDKGLTVQAGTTLLAKGAQIDSTSGSIGLSARQVTIGEARQRVSDRDSERKRDGKTQSRRDMVTTSDSAVSSTLTARDEMMIVARDGDISVTGSTLHSEQGGLVVQASKDIHLNSATESQYQFSDERSEKKGYLSKSSSHRVKEDHVTRETGTLLSGNTVLLSAGNDLTVTGSAVVGDNDVTLQAGNNIAITAATETQYHYLLEEQKKSGLMGSGGIGFTVGSKSSRHQVKEDGATQSQSVSTLGSSKGNLNLMAGNRMYIGGADLVAGQDLTITGDSVQIDPGYDKRTRKETFESKQSGLSLALSGTVGGALNTAVSTAQQANKESDGRLRALQGTKAALSGTQAALAYGQDNALTEAADAKNAAAGLKAGDEGAQQGATNTVGISLSYGSQSSRSETRTESARSHGSTLNAGKDLTITATGNGADGRGNISVQGSQLKAGADIALAATQDITLLSAQNTERIDSKNSSKGGSVGVGIGVGSGGYGVSVSASVNAGKGHEKGRSLTHSVTTLDAGQSLSLTSGRDTTLKGAQVSGEMISANVGRNLTLTSEQDSDRYDSQQQNASAGGSFTFGSMTGSASVNVSRNTLHSNYDSVTEQTGLFAGKGGFDIKVKDHTQLDGAVIAATATPDKNTLDTGTLGWTDIDNQADYKSEHQSAGFNSGGPVGGNVLSNVSALPLAGTNHENHASGTTKAAVSAGSLIVRDQVNQLQDISQLSRDPDHANDGSISPTFDKEKEQKRLQKTQLISDIGTQALDIYNTHAKTKATREATAVMSDNAALSQLKAQAKMELDTVKRANPAVENGPQAVRDKAWQMAYDNALSAQSAGMGGSVRMGVNAVVGALQGLAGGDIKAALAQGAAPYLADKVKTITTQGKPHSELSDEEKRNNVVAHAILGGVIAELSGANAVAGATGAASGEMAAPAIALALYGTADSDKLTSQQKENLGALSTLASGIAAGVSSGSISGATAGAQAGKNAVENNFLNGDEARAFEKEWTECKATGGDCGAVRDKYAAINARRNEELQQICTDSPLTCASYQKQLVDTGIDAATRPTWMPDWFGAPIRDDEIRGVVQTENAKALEYIHKNTDNWDRLGSFVAEPENVLGLAGTAKSFVASSATTTAKATGAAMSLGANAGVQVLEGKTGEKFDYTSFFTSGVSGTAGVGKSLNSNVRLNVGGAYFSSHVTGENSEAAMMGAAGGAALGFGVGTTITSSWEAKLIKEHFGMTASKNALKYSDSAFGPGYLFKESKLSSIPGISGGFVGAGTSEVSNSFVQGDIRKEKE
ncbi:hemagglutinin repeat-containing protein [Sodalis sp. RH14]|uniref:hemagglutinin repeat-containing protein n=1 Tax=Sodalis sp. RH14 TaxID=3394329 RepID=UPI0039B43189